MKQRPPLTTKRPLFPFLTLLALLALAAVPALAQPGPGARAGGGPGMMGMGMMNAAPGPMGGRMMMGPGMGGCMGGNCWKGGGCGCGMGRGHRGGGRIVAAAFREIRGYLAGARFLGLDDKQQERLEDLADDLAATAARTRADIQVARIRLQRLMAKDVPDTKAAEKLLERIAGLQTNVRVAAVKTAAEARKVLTAEQRAKVREMGPAWAMPMPMNDGPTP
ncbi:periplasmic heavy metal sensor [Dissulfurirhabdus thermomarina]|uniref:Periplasmic heavy metal sensor n=1 Tax=Dissulfurirhabdus thermomarina TaxID=1765737 RepID=A0A6N9TVX3_DISTH|nr:periplasmic heavy metal sensor [Dissulfurirhabdus thermomarina]NDY42626.1 periplasmic heavy metal sensor [Dissulfurirhabdus thermomarina]NMX23065.1 periplasmic heavy metal sensor [Dissulfurirhabdus thermomarina]